MCVRGTTDLDQGWGGGWFLGLSRPGVGPGEMVVFAIDDAVTRTRSVLCV